MTKRIIAIVLVLAMSVCLASCSDAGATVSSAASSMADSVKSFIKGDVTGVLNKEYSTQWFDFTVHSIKTAYEYKEYEAESGWKFVIVNVSETNTFGEPIPMSVWDFQLFGDGIEEEDTWGLEPFDDVENNMMPAEFYLEDGEEVNYDVVFVIHDEVTDVSFVYLEIADDDSTYATFTVKHSL